MDDVLGLLAKIFALGCALVFLLFVGWIVKRLLIERKPIPPGVADASRVQLMNLMNAEQQAAIEHQIHMEQEERAEDDQGAGD